MIAWFKKLAANRNLLKNLILRDLKHRYVGSVGGFLWSVIHPIVLLICYSFIFGVVFKPKIGPEFGTNSFAIFVLCGLLPWLLFSDIVMRNCSVITEAPPELVASICLSPGVWPNCRSSGAVTEEAMTSGLAPG